MRVAVPVTVLGDGEAAFVVDADEVAGPHCRFLRLEDSGVVFLSLGRYVVDCRCETSYEADMCCSFVVASLQRAFADIGTHQAIVFFVQPHKADETSGIGCVH